MQAFRYETVDSTNEMAKRLLGAGEVVAPAFVVAGEQTAGKGTRGRQWASPSGAGIYLSVIEVPPVSFSSPSIDLTAFTLAAGVACVECLRRLTGISVELKPINDLYVNGGKLGGILTEAVIERSRLTALITGIGINLIPAERIVDSPTAPITTLADVLGHGACSSIDVPALIEAIADDVHTLNLAVLSGQTDRVRWAWAKYRIPDSILPPTAPAA
jgi:BirA family biotin operon repressor/biotin-[acetyl-CoA-carboxylase] ligase